VSLTTHQAESGSGTTAPLYVVLNAGSGHEDTDRVAGIITERLTQAGRRHEILRVDSATSVEDAAREAVSRAQHDAGVVVAAGGDGTVNTVAQAALAARSAFGVIPQGTFNYFARSHGIPLDTDEAVAALLSARVRPVRVGTVNGHVFLVNASLGLYVETLEVREEQKERHGRRRVVALWAALLTALRRPRPMRIRLALERGVHELCTLTVFVGVNALQLEQMGLADVGGDDECLVAVVLRPVSNVGLLWLLVEGALGRLTENRHVESFRFGTLSVAPTHPRMRRVKVATDGEVRWLEPPLEFAFAAEPLRLLVPDSAAATESE
jgi:diacylglycerol kinase family enzyme